MATEHPSSAPDDVHNEMRRRLLGVMSLTTIGYIPFFALVQLATEGFYVERFLGAVAGVCGCAFSWWYSRRNRAGLGTVIFLLIITMMVMIGILRFGGGSAPGFGAGMVVVVAVVFLRGVRTAIAVGLLLVGVATIVTWGQHAGWLPPPPPVHGLTRLCVLAGAYVWILIFASVPLAILTRAVADARAERVVAECALAVRREAEDRYRVLCDASTAGIWQVDTAYRTVYLNRAMCAMLAVESPESVIGQPLQRFLTAASVGTMSEHHARHRPGIPCTYQVELVDVQGGTRQALVSGAPLLGADGAEIGLIGTFTDIGERLRSEQALAASEERYRALIEHAPDAIVIIDAAHGRFIEANPQAERLYGLDRATLLTRGPADVSPPAQEDGQASTTKALGLVQRAVDGGMPIFEWTHVDGAGRPFPCEVRLVRLPSADGRILIRGSVTDISQRKEAERQAQAFNALLERQVAERTAQLEAANRELESFSYSVSHDLRAPLRSIDGFSRAVLEDQGERLDETGRNYLDRVIAATRRMAELIDGMLALARVSRGEMAIGDTDLTILARQVGEDLLRALPDRRIELVVADGLRAHCDARLLRAVFDNLIGNALKFTSRRSDARIEIGGEADGGQVRIWVRDNGAGFDPAYGHQLFNAFQRLHTATEFPGTGIGLATVNRIIRRHGGTMQAEGAIGAGACFRFTLPA